jgi:lycopene cyclase domain-containing protein
LSFDRRVAFFKKLRAIATAILVMMALFVPMDMVFVAWRIWGFDERYILGIYLGNLPIEEWLFFPAVGYACLFIYECLRYYVPKNPLERLHRPILFGIALLGFGIALTHPFQVYTVLKVGATSVVILYVLCFRKLDYLALFSLMYLVSWVPFLLMNGVLTGSFIEGQVVWYNPAHIVGIRIFTIPFEDSYYSLLMLLLTVAVYERTRRAVVTLKQ